MIGAISFNELRKLSYAPRPSTQQARQRPAIPIEQRAMTAGAAIRAQDAVAQTARSRMALSAKEEAVIADVIEVTRKREAKEAETVRARKELLRQQHKRFSEDQQISAQFLSHQSAVARHMTHYELHRVREDRATRTQQTVARRRSVNEQQKRAVQSTLDIVAKRRQEETAREKSTLQTALLQQKLEMEQETEIRRLRQQQDREIRALLSRAGERAAAAAAAASSEYAGYDHAALRQTVQSAPAGTAASSRVVTISAPPLPDTVTISGVAPPVDPRFREQQQLLQDLRQLVLRSATEIDSDRVVEGVLPSGAVTVAAAAPAVGPASPVTPAAAAAVVGAAPSSGSRVRYTSPAQSPPESGRYSGAGDESR